MKRFDPGRVPNFRFMEGRYGADALGRFLSLSACAAIILCLFTRHAGKIIITNLLASAAMVLIVWCYSRILSKNLSRRQAENQKFLNSRQHIADWFLLRRDCFRLRKEYAFFKCPGCGCTVRVPRGKGKLRITCRRCGYSFERKT